MPYNSYGTLSLIYRITINLNLKEFDEIFKGIISEPSFYQAYNQNKIFFKIKSKNNQNHNIINLQNSISNSYWLYN
jgi:hypothetical protein